MEREPRPGGRGSPQVQRLAIALLLAAVTLLGLIRAAARLLAGLLAGLMLRAFIRPLARLLRLLAGLITLLAALLPALVLVSFRVVHSVTSKGTIAHAR